MIFPRLGKIICHFPQWTVLDDFCRAGKIHLPTFPNGPRCMIFAGLRKINEVPLFPSGQCRVIFQGWEKSFATSPSGPGDFCRAGRNHLPTSPNGQCWMIFAGLGKIIYPLSPMDSAAMPRDFSRLGKIICHFPQWTVLDDFCRAGKNHLPTFPNGQCQMILQGWEKSITRFPQWTVPGDCCRAGRNHLPLSPIASAG